MPAKPIERVRQVATRFGLGAAERLPASVRRAINIARGIETPHSVPCLPGSRPVVLAPHPDDELIGAGGAMLAHIARGQQPQIIHVTSGERTTGLAHLHPAERPGIREAEALAAAARLGMSESQVTFLRLPDGGVDADNPHHVDALAAALATLQPDLVYAPWPLDPHRDHVAVTGVLARALPLLDPSPTVALYEVWSPLTPTHLVDISAHIDTKLDALGEYRSALDSVDYLHTARGLAAYRSAQGQHGRGYAEAFTVLDADALAELTERHDDAQRGDTSA